MPKLWLVTIKTTVIIEAENENSIRDVIRDKQSEIFDDVFDFNGIHYKLIDSADQIPEEWKNCIAFGSDDTEAYERFAQLQIANETDPPTDNPNQLSLPFDGPVPKVIGDED